LERQNNVTDIVRLAVPDKLDLTFVIKEEKTVSIRQRLVLCQKPVNFLWCQVRHKLSV
jgi:hypothetical protein